MTLDRIKGQLVFECDGPKCHSFEEPETHDFREAVASLRDSGWTMEKLGEDWFHYCPQCKPRRQPNMKELLK